MIYDFAVGEPEVEVYTRMNWAHPSGLSDPQLSTKALSPFFASRQTFEEASKVFYEKLNVKIKVYALCRHFWFDASRPAIRNMSIVKISPSRIRNLSLSLPLSVHQDRAWWLQMRMSMRKNCLFFAEFPALQNLVIDISCRKYTPIPRSATIIPAVAEDKEILAWLLQGVSQDVDVHFVECPMSLSDGLHNNDPVRAADLEVFARECDNLRGTGPGVDKAKRQGRAGPELGFMAAWSARKRQVREKREQERKGAGGQTSADSDEDEGVA